MTEIAILLPSIGDEQPQQRKRKLESSRSSGAAAAPIQSFPKVDYNPWDDEEDDPVIEKEYNRQFVESDGFDVDYFYLPYGGELVPHLVENKYDYPYDIGLSTCLVDLDFTVTILRREQASNWLL